MIEGNIKNVELVQGYFGCRQFKSKNEVIETVGVLHHMEKPEKGLNIA